MDFNTSHPFKGRPQQQKKRENVGQITKEVGFVSTGPPPFFRNSHIFMFFVVADVP